MEIQEKFLVNAPVKKVWEFIINPDQIGSCVPGCESIEAIDGRTYVATVKAGVGPIKVKFKITTSLTQIDEPKHIHMEGKGADLGMAGSFNQSSDVHLRAVSEDETEVSYSSNVTVVGRIALFGDRIMRAQAKKIGAEFISAVKEKIEGHKEK
ncbi:MAG: Carbon monoxide dehydrogenase subunit G (CoxG) [Syntrophorhabdaceae bacterium PtaU1.Bin034]|nr:MAG: Carbon monoxide dehydrogenase subunit G (CoxG) [Syntrophorhabdaceae bacterium PtaU1.Bin034]